jgi:hypothetical protein
MRKILSVALLLCVASAGFALAAEKQSAKVEIPYDSSWAGKTIPAGEYTFKWQGEGDDVAVTILRGHQVVAEGKGHIEQLKAKAPNDAVVARPQDSGPRLLSKIEFGGKSMVLVLAQS